MRRTLVYTRVFWFLCFSWTPGHNFLHSKVVHTYFTTEDLCNSHQPSWIPTLIYRFANTWASPVAQLIITCNAGVPSLIPGPGSSSGEGIGDLLQYSRASLVAQTVKNPSAVWKTWVWPLVWEGPLAEGMATRSLPGESPWTEEPGALQSTGLQKVRCD